MMRVQLKKGGYDTFMQKEMHEQPYVIKETLRAHIENNLAMPELSGLDVSKSIKSILLHAELHIMRVCMLNTYCAHGLIYQFTALVQVSLDMEIIELMKTLYASLFHNLEKQPILWRQLKLYKRKQSTNISCDKCIRL